MTRTRTELGPYCQGEYLGRNNFEGIHTERVYALLAKAPSVVEIIEHSITLELIDQLLPKIFCFQRHSPFLYTPAKHLNPSTMTMALPVFLSTSRVRALASVQFGHSMISTKTMGLPR